MAVDLSLALEQLAATLIAIGLHEYGHAKVADMAGDDTPRLQGRVTLNLTKHWDPLGTLLIVLSVFNPGAFIIGWGKPVQVNPSRMKNPRWDHFWSVLAGPLSNLLQAGVAAILLRVMLMMKIKVLFVATFLLIYIMVNIGLMLFNLIPLGPLDGHWLVGAFMPEEARYRWFQFNRTYGSMLLLGILFLGNSVPQLSFWTVLGPAYRFLTRFLIGVDLS